MTQRPEPYAALATDENFDRLEWLERLSDDRGTSMAGTALAWLLADERIAQVVIGPGRPEHLEPVREAIERPLTPDERRQITETFRLMRVLTLSNADIHAALSPADCERAMAGVLAARARGDAFNPLRTVTIPPGAAGFIGLMPAYVSAAPAGEAGRATPAAGLRAQGDLPHARQPGPRPRRPPGHGRSSTTATPGCRPRSSTPRRSPRSAPRR